jgi:ferredoxin-NADP reductase
MNGDLVALYRVTSSADIIFADELDHIASTHRSRIEYLVGDHRTSDASDLLSPTHLKELVPDIAERDVYICGPPGLINTIIPNLRRAAVPRHHLHVERFAL